jgi:hypothetical protein
MGTVLFSRMLIGVGAVVLASSQASAAPSPRKCQGLTDNILCMPLPRGWSESVGFGHTPAGPAAWMHAGNFHFDRFSARNEGFPRVPAHRVLITIGDFPPIFTNWRWRHSDRLRLPRHKLAWRVIFHGRALFVSVHFGSKPNARTRALVNRRLASVRRVG